MNGCIVENCDVQGKKRRGLCANHYEKWRRGTLGFDPPTTKAHTDEERMKRYIDKETSPSGCWLWTGATDGKGYGRVSKRSAHRWVYEILVGSIPEAHDLDHQCHNEDENCPGGLQCLHRRCVNPDHLEPTTRKVNLNRGSGYGGAKHRRKTICVNGHDISTDDKVYTFINQSGGVSRKCMACTKLSASKNRKK